MTSIGTYIFSFAMDVASLVRFLLFLDQRTRAALAKAAAAVFGRCCGCSEAAQQDIFA